MSELRSPHALDLPLMFGTFKTDRLASFLSGDGPETMECSEKMIKSWVQFAKTGNPGWDNLSPKIFGANENDQQFKELSPSIFLSPREQNIWKDFLNRCELDYSMVTFARL